MCYSLGHTNVPCTDADNANNYASNATKQATWSTPTTGNSE